MSALRHVARTMYHVRDGRIHTWSLETHLVDHCNLRCAQCCTLSPQLSPRVMPAAVLRRDLERVRSALRPHLFKLTGGEPLLHPDLLACLEVAKASKIADQVQVTTNGFRIKQVPEAFWTLVDRLVVSWYTSAPLPTRVVTWIEEKCAEHDVHFTIKPTGRFATLTRSERCDDEAVQRDVFGGCWLKVRCHLLYYGRFYACTRPPHLAQVQLARGEASALHDVDGVVLDGPNLGTRLMSYLERDEPLDSCAYCEGASGAYIDHQQLAAEAVDESEVRTG